MEFSGQVWFTFGDADVWRFYGFTRALAGAGVTVALDWVPLVAHGEGSHERSAAAVYVSLEQPSDRGRFLHAMLGLVHLEGMDPIATGTIDRALAGAEMSMPDTSGAASILDELEASATGLGVNAVPSMYRHGPVMAVSLTGAATSGDLERRAALMLDVLDDDGLWGLVKP